MELEERPLPARRAAVFSVHLFTASGGAVALLALYAAIERDFPSVSPGSAWRCSSTGSTARWRAPRASPRPAATIDGVVLDLVVDFLAYVLVPVVALWRSDLMPTSAPFGSGLSSPSPRRFISPTRA